MAVTTLIFQSCKKEEEKNNQPPTCNITAPANGQQEIAKGEKVIISVDAEDSDGNISEVRFFIDGVGKGSASSFPFNYNWNTSGESLGSHTIKATSLDNNGGSKSDEISVTIIAGGSAPIAHFTVSPSGGSTFTNFAFDASGSTDNPDSTNFCLGFRVAR